MDELYDLNAEYYDAITTERVEELAGVVERWAERLGGTGTPVIDVGAGTGRIATRLAAAVAPREVFAVEPSRGLRAILASRLADDADLNRRVTVVPFTLDDAEHLLPDRLDGAIAFGVLPHLDASTRGHLLTFLARRLDPDGSALVEVMPPWTAEPVPLTPMGSFAVGRHRIECSMQAEPVGPDELVWTMTYRRVAADGTVLHEVAGPSRCRVIAPDQFLTEARAHGLDGRQLSDDLVELSVARTSPRSHP